MKSPRLTEKCFSIKFSRTEGKTPAFVEGEVQTLPNAIETSTHTGLRERALLGNLAYTFARIGAVVNLKVESGSDRQKNEFALRIQCVTIARNEHDHHRRRR
jgi:site-specific recombinase XerD